MGKLQSAISNEATLARCQLLIATFANTMKFVRRIPPFIYNKYFLSTSLFVVWMLFFDRNDFFTQTARKKELAEIERSKDYFAQKIAEGKKFSKDMRSSADAVEKFVREKYLMKRDNEDLFLVQKPAAKE
jgi:cell division protein DivIC